MAIRTMRKEAGGLICTTANHEIGEKLQVALPADVLSNSGKCYPILDLLAPNDIPYDTKSAFSITINQSEDVHGHN